MKIPRYWHKQRIDLHEHEALVPDYPREIFCWGWSAHSQQQAEAHAASRAHAILQKILNDSEMNSYLYSDRPLREEILQEFKADDGEQSFVITRNSYGCTVLNSASAAFVDIDYPPKQINVGLIPWLKSLFSKKQPDWRKHCELQATNTLRDYLHENPQAHVRVYQTYAGLRYLFTHRQLSPTSDDTHALIARLGGDPLYSKLCRIQQCFRARLSPKPWRCGLSTPKIRFPSTNRQDMAKTSSWIADYEKTSVNFKTCNLLFEEGSGQVHSQIRPIIRLHDEATGIRSDLPLA